MKRFCWCVMLTLMALSLFGASARANQTCSPEVFPGTCSYAGCLVAHGGGLSSLPVTQCTEVCCALCDDQVEILVYGAPLAGRGMCSSTTAANFCVSSGEWCSHVRGGNFLPNPCDPPKGHGRIDFITTGEVRAQERPPAWMIDLKGEVFVLMQYEPKKSLVEKPDTEAAGLYFVTSADEQKVGKLAVDRRGLAYSISHLLSFLNDGGEASVSTRPPDTSLAPGAARSAPLVRVGKWAAEWRETPVLRDGYFIYSPYPRLLYRGRPATLEDIQAAGLDPQPVP